MNTKTAFITIRVTPEQKALVEKTAATNNMSVSDYTKTALTEKLGDNKMCQTSESEALSEYVNIEVSFTKEQAKKISDMSTELGATKQECIRRLVREGNVYAIDINIDLEEEFLSLTSQVKALNNMISGIYTVVKKSDGVFTKREVDHMYEVMHEIRDSSYKILASVHKTCGQVKEMANRRMVKLIKEKTGR